MDPMDPRTGAFVRLNGKPYRLEPLDAQWVLERCPSEMTGQPDSWFSVRLDLQGLRVDVHDDR